MVDEAFLATVAPTRGPASGLRPCFGRKEPSLFWSPSLPDVPAAAVSGIGPTILDFSSEGIGASPVQIEAALLDGSVLAGCSPVVGPSVVQDGMLLGSDGLLSAVDSSACSDSSSWSPRTCFPNVARSPRSVMDTFCMSLSPASKLGPSATVDGHQQVVSDQLVAQDIASLRGSYQRPISPVLPRPAVRHSRGKRTYAGSVRCSGRIRG
jgi:hypothetical protein